MVEEIKRTPEQKEYRNKLANTLKNLRQLWQEELARTLLESEKNKDKYKDSKRWNVKVRNEIRDFNDNEMKELLEKIAEIKRRREETKWKSWLLEESWSIPDWAWLLEESTAWLLEESTAWLLEESTAWLLEESTAWLLEEKAGGRNSKNRRKNKKRRNRRK